MLASIESVIWKQTQREKSGMFGYWSLLRCHSVSNDQ